jgi:hypothetical protein
MAWAKAAGATSASFPRMSRPGIYGNCRRHLVFVICGEPHLVVGDIPGLDADHAAPGGVAEIDHGGGLFSPGIPHHARGGADLFDDDAAAPPVGSRPLVLSYFRQLIAGKNRRIRADARA